MKKYEITFIVGENYNEIQAKEIAKETKKFLESYGAKFEQDIFWGKRKFAYKIAKNSFGYYFVFVFDLEPNKSGEITHELNLNEKILRYIFVDYIEPTSFYEENTGDGKRREDRPERTEEKKEFRKPKKFVEEVEEVKEESVEKEEKVEEAAEAKEATEETKEEAKEEKAEPKKASKAKETAKPTPPVEEEKTEELEEEVEEEKPRAKKMTEDERKAQLEQKLAELLKDEE